MKNCKINYTRLIGPGLVWAAGLAMIIIFAPRTVYINGMVGLGFLALCIGTFLGLCVLCQEYDREGEKWPSFLDGFFPNYPVIEDKNELMRRLSGFRKSYSDYLSNEREEKNSSLQDYASQLMWHSTALQKKLDAYTGTDNQETAFFFHDEIIPLMSSLRASIDQAEVCTDRTCWPMPSYRELLFGLD